MSMSKKSTKWLIIAAVLLTAAIFALDLTIPLGVAGGVPYMAPVMLTLWLPQRWYTIGFAIAGTVLTLLGLLFSPMGGEEWKVIFNRALALFVIWVAASLVMLRIRTEAALRRSEATNWAFIQAIPDLMSRVRRDGTYLDSGAARDEDLPHLPEWFPGKSVFDALLPEVAQPTMECIERALQSGEIQILETQLVIQGEMREREARFVASGPDEVLVIVRDTTERKRAEEALRESEERFRTLSTSAPIGIFRADATGRPNYINQAMQAIFGSGPEESLGDVWNRVVHPDDREWVLEEWARAVRTKRPFSAEYRLVARLGELRWVSEQATPMFSGEGNLAGYVGTSEDITERKWAEDRLEERVREMHFFPQLNPAPLLRFDAGGTVLSANPAAVAFLGEGANQHVLLASLLPSTANMDLEQCIREGLVTSHDAQVGERYFQFVIRGVPELGTGHVYGSDITEHKRAEELLLQSQKLETMGRLAGGVAHDFNNQLMAMMGYVELGRAGLPSGHPVAAHLEEIQKAGDRASNLTQQLLAFSRRQSLSLEVIDLNDLILNMDEMLRRLIGEDIELVTLPRASEGNVKVDRLQVENLLVNLAVNARDAMPTGGKLTIETANVILDAEFARRHDDAPVGPCVRLTVGDTGVGMEEEVMAHIFEPFFTTKEVGKGTGLGLPTCYGIIKQSGGSILCRSEPGRGTSFDVYLPVSRERQEARTGEAEAGAMPQGSETVLLAEDEPLVRDLLAGVLRAQGYNV
jgi:PAS domain S-box-containing protein